MQKIIMIAAAVLVGVAITSYAAGKGNHQRNHSELTPDQLGYAESPTNGDNEKHSPFATQMGGYSLKFDTTERQHIGPPDPSGVSQFRGEPLIPGLGFKLSKPIYNDFWPLGGSSEKERE
jgi:hypothetical protein